MAGLAVGCLPELEREDKEHYTDVLYDRGYKGAAELGVPTVPATEIKPRIWHFSSSIQITPIYRVKNPAHHRCRPRHERGTSSLEELSPRTPATCRT